MTNAAEEFRRHADECRRMARNTLVSESKATWNGMAERWLHCAEKAEAQARPEHRTPRYRGDEKSFFRKAS